MRFLICAGGTGGGVYPALTVLQTLGAEANPVLWVGGQGGLEAALVQRAGVPFTAIPAAGLHGVGITQLPRNALLLLRGLMASQRILKNFKPDVLMFTGGYVAVPMALTARRIPTLLYVPDIEPGWALKFLAHFADVIAVTAEETRAYLPARARVVVTGYPTRPELSEWTPEKGKRWLGLSRQFPTLLVYGGSRGARTINRSLLACLPQLLDFCQIIHISGELDWKEVETFRSSLPEILQKRYRAFPYVHEMGAVLASADLAITRAGASSLGELPLFGLPAILVPYPYAWRYQKVNAAYLERRGAAIVVENEQLSERLLPLVKELLADQPRLSQMRQTMQLLARPQAARELAVLVRELAGGLQG
jgi:undecaprenyldiphospho-muramoylpentapeptide beta-N-acetylglucosaminyltransferase